MSAASSSDDAPAETGGTPLRVLILEDRPEDAELMVHELRRGGYEVEWERVETEEGFITELGRVPDVILSDFSMPSFDSLEALRLVRERNLDTPFVFVSGTLGEEQAVEAMKAGASDYLLKDRLGRLSDAVRLAVERRSLRTGHERVQAQLARSYEELKAAHAATRRLLSRLIDAQEEERKLIAGDIHDDSIQVMTAVGLRLQMLRDRLSDPDLLEAFGKLDETVQLTIKRLRRLLFELRPMSLESEGLAETLTTYLEQTFEDQSISYRVDYRLDVDPPLETRVVLYRASQEVLANVRKHSRASRVDVVLEESEGGVALRISDDGVGFDLGEIQEETAPGHLGIPALVERAELSGGWCRIMSAPGEGTTVEFWLPVNASPEASDADG